MKRMMRIFPFFLIMIVLFGGTYIAGGIADFAPDYMNKITGHAKPAGTSAQYSGSEELIVYPWNFYSEKTLSPNTTEMNLTDSTLDVALSTAFSRFSSKGAFPEKYTDLLTAISIGSGRYAFLKDYRYTGTDGKGYLCNIAWDFLSAKLLYYKVDSVDTTVPGTDVFEAAATELRNSTKIISSMEFYEETPDLRNSETYLEKCGASEEDIYIIRDLQKFVQNFIAVNGDKNDTGTSYRNIFSFLFSQTNVDILVYNQDIMVVYQENNRKLILYYSPETRRITGFSVQF